MTGRGSGFRVGMKGTRVQAVVQELRGEKIDIVHWIPDQAEYVCRALAPAKVSKIIIDDDEHSMEVIVPDDQLSLAIGKKGQNVRLASRLTGWRIDVRSEAEAEEETRRARQSSALFQHNTGPSSLPPDSSLPRKWLTAN
jgi:N utilization substance protein A